MQGCVVKPVCGKINLENVVAEFRMNQWFAVCPTTSIPWALYFHQYTMNKALEMLHVKCVHHIWFWHGWCPHAYCFHGNKESINKVLLIH
eukprot:5019198-Ditylum_brightwellii.AAC.1